MCELLIHDFKYNIITGSMSSVFSSKIHYKNFNNLSYFIPLVLINLSLRKLKCNKLYTLLKRR